MPNAATLYTRLLATAAAQRYIRWRARFYGWLFGTPTTGPPEAHTIASWISESQPPQRPSTRTAPSAAVRRSPSQGAWIDSPMPSATLAMA